MEVRLSDQKQSLKENRLEFNSRLATARQLPAIHFPLLWRLSPVTQSFSFLKPRASRMVREFSKLSIFRSCNHRGSLHWLQQLPVVLRLVSPPWRSPFTSLDVRESPPLEALLVYAWMWFCVGGLWEVWESLELTFEGSCRGTTTACVEIWTAMHYSFHVCSRGHVEGLSHRSSFWWQGQAPLGLRGSQFVSVALWVDLRTQMSI